MGQKILALGLDAGEALDFTPVWRSAEFVETVSQGTWDQNLDRYVWEQRMK